MRVAAVEGVTENIAGAVRDLYYRWVRVLRFPDYITRIYPEMAAAQPFNGTGGNLYPVFNDEWIHKTP